MTAGQVYSRTRMAKLLGIDVGTSACKAVLLDENGEVLKTGTAEYPISTPKPGWTEQNPADWVKGVQEAIEKVGESSPDAIGLTGQMHGSVFLDKDGQVIRPALLWNDQRTAAQCEAMDQKFGRERIVEITGNPPMTGFQVPKVLWLRDQEPEAFARLSSVLLPKDYIRLILTGAFATDVSDASGTGILDLKSRNWSSELISGLGLSQIHFPEVHESIAETGKTKGGFAGLKDGIPVAAGGGDQAAGAIGSGMAAPGKVCISLGTSGVVFTCLDQPKFDPQGRVHTFCHANGKWHAMGVMLSCGGAMKWVKDTLFDHLSYADFDALATSAEPGSKGLIFHPYLTGERSPFADPFARGSWQGLNLSHGQAEIVRSAMEGVCFGLKGCLEVIQTLGASPNELTVSSGGARSSVWVQMLADIFELPATVLEAVEGPAAGAALLAGVMAGVFDSVQATQYLIKRGQTFAPSGTDYSPFYRRFCEAPIIRSES